MTRQTYCSHTLVDLSAKNDVHYQALRSSGADWLKHYGQVELIGWALQSVLN